MRVGINLKLSSCFDCFEEEDWRMRDGGMASWIWVSGVY